MSELDRLLAERACERLIIEFVRRLDLGEPAAVADLFTQDGVWEWALDSRRITGREALRDYFGSRPADRLSRRLSTNILVDVLSDSEAVATSYFATWRVDGYAGGMLPPRLPTNVGNYEDRFAKVDGRWLLAHRSLFLPFGGPTAPADENAPVRQLPAWQTPTMPSTSRHVSEQIDASAAEVYDYASDPAHLPEWAPGLVPGGSLHQVDGDWILDSPDGPVVITFAPRNELGVMDHQVRMPTGQTFYNPMRVAPDGERSEIVFSVRRQPGSSDAEFDHDVAAVTEDLATLKQILESRRE